MSGLCAAFSFSPPFNFLSSHQPVIVIKNFSFFVEKKCALVGCSCVEVGPIKVLFKKEVKFSFLCLKINGFDHFLTETVFIIQKSISENRISFTSDSI